MATGKQATTDQQGNNIESHLLNLLQPTAYYDTILEAKCRPNGRKLNEFRNVKVETGTLPNQDGSSAVSIGNTSVYCGVRYTCTKNIAPFVSEAGTLCLHLRDALLHINVTLDEFTGSRAYINRDEVECSLKQQLRRVLYAEYGKDDDDDPLFDLEQLVYETIPFPSKPDGEMQQEESAGQLVVTRLEVNLVVLQCDGAVLDAALLAILAAIRDVKLPANISLDDSGAIFENVVEQEDDRQSASFTPRRITLNYVPVSLTLGLYRDLIICDPAIEEEHQPDLALLQTLFVLKVSKQKHAKIEVISKSMQKLSLHFVSPKLFLTCLQTKDVINQAKLLTRRVQAI